MKSVKIPTSSVKCPTLRTSIKASFQTKSHISSKSVHVTGSSPRLFSSGNSFDVEKLIEQQNTMVQSELNPVQRKEKMEKMAKFYFENDKNQAHLQTFDGVLHGAQLKHVDVEKAQVVCTLKVGQNHVNIKNTMHGGCTCLLVDNVGTLAVRIADLHGRSGVSTDLNVSFFLALNLHETITIDAKIIKTGKSLAFVGVDIFNEKGSLAAQGRMTKALGPIPSDEKSQS